GHGSDNGIDNEKAASLEAQRVRAKPLRLSVAGTCQPESKTVALTRFPMRSVDACRPRPIQPRSFSTFAFKDFS
ncbi:hypothetical protein, partial [Pseudomonas syringae]|uniref:hypothetical protein n=1 Tax=Pseudomonas syringae TaxID=317 RepID=UPI001F213EAD